MRLHDRCGLNVRSFVLMALLIPICFVIGSDLGDPHAREKESLAPVKSEDVVKIQAVATPPDASGKQDVTVTLTIDDGWHIYPNAVAPGETGEPTTLSYAGKMQSREFTASYPPGKTIHDPNLNKKLVCYTGTVTLRARLVRENGDRGPIDMKLHFMACCHVIHQGKCFPPTDVKLTVP